MEMMTENESIYCDDNFNVIVEGKKAFMSDGLSPYKNTKEGYEGCFGCNNKMCVDILVDENTVILNETENYYCNDDFKLIKVREDFGNKIVYEATQSDTLEYLETDCAKRGGTFNECGSVCRSDAEVCVAMCGLTCENLS